MSAVTLDNFVEQIVNAAEAHDRESEPGMAIGDLEQTLNKMWLLLDVVQRRHVIAWAIEEGLLDWLEN